MFMMMTMQVKRFRHDNDETKNPIYVTSQDKQRLEDLLMEVEASDPRKHGDLKALTEELHRAVIVGPKDVAGDVITMNSRAEMRDLESGETVAFTLVFPSEANIDEEKISVLAPIGAGMLGYRVGDQFEWKVPGGLRRMKVTKVHYQPEAAGDFDR
jgi:regulator of nucleoside diphosphate kinase